MSEVELEDMTTEQLLGQIMYLRKAVDRLEDELQEAQQWVDYWAELWERSSNLLMQHHPAFTKTTEVTLEDKTALVKELFGDDLLVKVRAVEDEDTEDES